MLNEMKGDRLPDLFRTAMLQDYFATLSESLGFHLSVYSSDGERIFGPRGKYHLCQRLRDHSPAFPKHCVNYCRPFLMKTISTGKPDVFTCYTKIVNFALPIRYRDEQAVILGQGSFASEQDFREGMKRAAEAGLDEDAQNEPAVYTSIAKAWDVCGFVDESINTVLNSCRESTALRKEFDSVKRAIGSWTSSTGERPETLYRSLGQDLSSLIHSDGIAVFMLDGKQGRYTALSGHAKGNGNSGEISISEDGEIAQSLSAGRPFVFTLGPLPIREAGKEERQGGLYFFPVLVNRKLEGILCVAARSLAESETQIIAAFCRKTALSLENQRLHQELYRKFERFAAIADVTKSITQITDFNMLLRTILDESASLLKAEQGSLMLIDRETDDLLLSAKKGLVDGVTDQLRITRGEGIAGKVAEYGEAILVEDVENDPRIRQKNRSHYKTRSFVSVPIKIEDQIIGVLNLSDKSTGEVFDDEDLKLIQSFTTHAAIVMDRNIFQSKTEELEKLSITDPLTSLMNRRYLNERLKRELARAERHGHHLSLLMVDIDGFKHCNDSFGHPFGDTVLRNVADILVNTVRSMDIVARCGGDEFIVILPETAEPVAVEIATRLLRSLEKKIEVASGVAEGSQYKLTASIGVVCYPKDGETLEMLHEHVDQALYQAKNNGKNRVEVFRREERD